MVKERNINLDIIRGIAAYSVVANHVLSHFEGFSESIVGNINFSLQNPLFMMVSGWALIYARPITDLQSMMLFIKKRSVLLLLPWMIWSLIKYAILSDETFIEFLSNSVYHMEGLYWFLFSLWVMNIIWAVSSFVFKKWNNQKYKFLFSVIGLSLFLSATMFVIAYQTVGISLLGIKFTTYYFPFFLGGWLFSLVYKASWSAKVISVFGCLVLISTVSYMILISRFDVRELPDSWAIFRMAISFMGCLVVFQAIFFQTFNPENRILKILQWGGIRTLELYVVHYITMGFLKTSGTSITIVLGMAEYLINLVIVLGVTCLIIEIINSNNYSRNILFGKFKF